ncbi:hypothetical protein OpiT1DRAFT_01687 [Opitutaceae bacterium TAV1]|nr:hypothetical protein OPIT5_03245 [Opitutaceae bacterium TAV5]EIP97254.1 hypothetical protein OpiT1DRAFT_01687 [Opitutaceae bacterium TAV1]
MKVTRAQIIVRGLTLRCPNCGGRTLFRKGAPFRLNRECPQCGLRLERDEGSFLGAMSLNYIVTTLGFLVPVLLLYLAGVLSGLAAAIIAGVGALLFPVLFYRASRSWWLMGYYLFFPGHLSANLRELREGEDENI